MATPGWYSDPAGRPGGYRYWDGEAWGAEVTDNPFGAPPAGPGPQAPDNPFDTPTDPEGTVVVPAYDGYEGYQDYGQQYPLAAPPRPPAPPGPEADTTGRTLALVLVAVGVTLVLGVVSFFVTRQVTDDDPSSSAAPASPGASSDQAPSDPASPPPSPFDDQQTPTIQQCEGGDPLTGAVAPAGGMLSGGGLTMPEVEGYDLDPFQAEGFVFADGTVATSRVIEQGLVSGWVSVYVLGGLDKSVGFNTPEQAAGVVLECMASSPDFYSGFTGASVTDSRATTVAGSDAWEMTAEIRIEDPELTVEGDVAKVIVVDTGDPETFGLFVSLVPIGDAELIAQQDAQVGQLALE